MTKILDTSDSNNILKTILIILIVAGIAYLIYHLYNQNTSQNYMKENEVMNRQMPQAPPPQREQTLDIESVQYKMNGSPSGQQNPVMNKIDMLPKGRVVGENAIEHFSTNQD